MHDSQWIDWVFLDAFPCIKDLVQLFHDMGLLKVMEFKHNWNELAIFQFYATLEVDMEDESLAWMTVKKSFAALF